MDIFVSWSGERSKAVAELLVDWVKSVLQVTKPWISTRDIDKGSLWFSEISSRLQATSAGIICLTQDNKNNPWILFESGALAKGISASRICTFLVDLKPSDIKDPLAQFNHTTPDREGMFSLVRTLNRSLGENSLADTTLKRAFDAYWPQFLADFNAALDHHQPTVEIAPRPENDMLSELLEITRGLSARLRNIEADKPREEFGSSARLSFEIPSSSVISEMADMIAAGMDKAEIIDIFMERGYRTSTINSILNSLYMKNMAVSLDKDGVTIVRRNKKRGEGSGENG